MLIKSAIAFLVAATMASAGPLANPDPAALTKRGCYYSDVLGGAYFYCGSKDGHDALINCDGSGHDWYCFKGCSIEGTTAYCYE